MDANHHIWHLGWFHSNCSLFDSMTDLSPAAQKVLDATDYPEDWATRVRVAAALRAVVDQVAPKNYACFTGHVEWDQGMETMNDLIREEILTIAAELEQ
jgi:hypothetical protein